MSPIAPVFVQRRMMELGRVRLGEKGASGEPKKLGTFRFTSASGTLLAAVAERYGGKPRDWKDAPNEGMFEVVTDATELNIILPPTFSEQDGSPSTSYSQWFELWSAGGCQRRCDGITEALSGDPCLCNPDDRKCDVTTRVSFMLPEIPGLGVWRLDSKGWNAAVELPGTLELLIAAAREQTFIPAVLRLENRVKKVDKQTRRFVVPVIDLPNVTVGQLVSGTAPNALNAPGPEPPKPALPPAPAKPADPSFEAQPDMGAPPELPKRGSAGTAATAEAPSPTRDVEPSSDTDPAPSLTAAAFKHQCAAAIIAPPQIREAGKRLFPGRTSASLSDEERGVLFAELIAEKDGQQVIA